MGQGAVAPVRHLTTAVMGPISPRGGQGTGRGGKKAQLSSCMGWVQDLGRAGCNRFAAGAVACPQGLCCPLLYSFSSLFLHREEEGGKLLAANPKAH